MSYPLTRRPASNDMDTSHTNPTTGKPGDRPQVAKSTLPKEGFKVPRALVLDYPLFMSLTLTELRVYPKLCDKPSDPNPFPYLLCDFLSVTDSYVNHGSPDNPVYDYSTVYAAFHSLSAKGLIEMKDAEDGFACLRNPFDSSYTHPSVFVLKP